MTKIVTRKQAFRLLDEIKALGEWKLRPYWLMTCLGMSKADAVETFAAWAKSRGFNLAADLRAVA